MRGGDAASALRGWRNGVEMQGRIACVRNDVRAIAFLQYFHGNPCAGLGIGEGVVMVFKGVAAGGRHGMQLVVGQLRSEMAARGPAGAKELVVRIIHLIGLEHGLEATLIERAVVGHQGQSGDAGCYLSPHVWKERCGVGIGVTEPMNLLAEPRVVVGSGPDERVEGVGDEAAAHHYHAHAAHTAALSVGGLKVDSCKVVHNSWLVAGISVGKGTIFFGGKNKIRECQIVS